MGVGIVGNKKKTGKQQEKEGLSRLLGRAFTNSTVHSAPRMLGRLTVQDSIPITAVHEKENLVETYPGLFTRLYTLGENNYQTETLDVQEQMFVGFRSVLNSLGVDCEIAFTVFNQDVDFGEFKEAALMKEAGDSLDGLRREMNNIILDRIREGRNGLRKCKYITLGLHAADLKKADEVFSRRLEGELSKQMKKLSSAAVPVPVTKRLEILHDIYNIDSQGEFLTHTRIPDANGEAREVDSFDLEDIRSQGLTVRDVVAPSSMQVFPKYMRLGSKFVRVMRVDQYPAQLSDEFFIRLTDVPFNLLSTINIQPIPSAEANRIVHRNYSLAQNEKAEAARKLAQEFLPEDMIPPAVREKVEKAEELREDMVGNDEKLFKTVHTVVFWADSMDRLQEYTDTIVSICQSSVVGIHIMEEMQEEGFYATLPLLWNGIPYKMKRTLKSSSAACAAMPFSAMELSDPGGINYSMNLSSRNLILYNRLLCQNYNGFILGTPGAGKSFAGKVEMLNVMLGSSAKCIVIDPESEYHALAKLIGGEVIRLMPGGKWHINPMEVTPGYEYDGEEGNPVLAKADFILKLLEVIIKTPFGLNSIQETIIDECVHGLYRPFMAEDGRLGKIPEGEMPTLTDLQAAFAGRTEPEARELAMALKLYTGEGSLNVFGGQSNVDVNNRFVVYDIKDVGYKLKPMAMLIILDAIQNNLFENRRRGKMTWFWVDECHLLFQDEMTASALSTIWKRARKYGGVPTGITQNVDSLLKSETCRTMLSNCNFIQILNQAAADREQLRVLLNLSDAQVDVVTSAPKGQGLIYTGSNCVAFHSVFPKDNSIYRCLTSNMREIKEYEEQERRMRAAAVEE